ncbi:MAG: hypothetical protein WAN36_05795 [Calditrichia bacterium]
MVNKAVRNNKSEAAMPYDENHEQMPEKYNHALPALQTGAAALFYF